MMLGAQDTAGTKLPITGTGDQSDEMIHEGLTMRVTSLSASGWKSDD
jgi:hypothetical protein